MAPAADLRSRRARALRQTPRRLRSAALPPFPAEAAGRLCRLVLLRLLPGLVRARFRCRSPKRSARSVRALGDHFAPVQGGRLRKPAASPPRLAWLRDAGFAGDRSELLGSDRLRPRSRATEAERSARDARDALRLRRASSRSGSSRAATAAPRSDDCDAGRGHAAGNGGRARRRR